MRIRYAPLWKYGALKQGAWGIFVRSHSANSNSKQKQEKKRKGVLSWKQSGGKKPVRSPVEAPGDLHCDLRQAW
jgi:hypothetical protein